MNTNISLVLITFFSLQFSNNSDADWNPECYNAIKWTAPNQDQATIANTTSQGITRVPIAYHGGVDWNETGTITEDNIKRFTRWVQNNLPSDYCGPIVLDYERPWWKELSAKSISQERLQEILSVYIKGVQTAQEVLPEAQWGYWGLPLLRNTGRAWQEQGLTLHALTSQCSALYPDVYDGSPGNLRLDQTKLHIEKTLEMAQGKIPVYVFVSPRFTGQHGDHSQFIPSEVFLRKVNSAMQAVWRDQNGAQHRIQGLILWDTFGFSEESEWDDLDQKHKHYFELLQALVQAWAKAMNGIEVKTGVPEIPFAKYGLPEPTNSGATLKTTRISEENNNQIQEPKEIERNRIPSGRIPSGRE